MSEVEAARTLGEALRAERRRRRETQRQTAVFFGVSQPTYHHWENDMAVPPVERRPLIADYLGVAVSEVDRLVDGDGFIPLGVADRVEVLERKVAELLDRLEQRD